MNFLKLIPVVISFLLLAAHFYRAGQDALVLVSVLLPCLLVVRKTWVPRLLQLALLLGAVEWLRTLWFIARMRIESGLPWERMAAILGTVALITALSALVFTIRSVRLRYSGKSIPRP